MHPYKIASAATVSASGVEVVFRGPGIGPAGLRQRFASIAEADRFVDALNMAFEHGFRKGREPARKDVKAAGGQA